MATVNRNKRKSTSGKYFEVIDPGDDNQEKETYVDKKTREAKEFLDRVGMPDEYYQQMKKIKDRQRKSV